MWYHSLRHLERSSCYFSKVWDVTRRGIKSILQSHNNWVVSLDFYPSTNRLVSTSLDRTARIWNTLPSSYGAWNTYPDVDNPIILTLNDQLTATGSQAAWCSAVSYDGLLVAVGGEDGCISFCNAVTGRLVERVTRAHADWISGIVFLKDGTGVASSSFDGTIKIWKWGNDNIASILAESRSSQGQGAGSEGLGVICTKVLEDNGVSCLSTYFMAIFHIYWIHSNADA